MIPRNRNLFAILFMSALLILATSPGLMADCGKNHASTNTDKTSAEARSDKATGEHSKYETSMTRERDFEDGSWIRISGTIAEIEDRNSFKLDYGPEVIEVDLEQWGWTEDNFAFSKGDKVTVYGQVDDDFFQDAEIEASSVFAQSTGTYHYAMNDKNRTIGQMSKSEVDRKKAEMQRTGKDKSEHMQKHAEWMNRNWDHDEHLEEGKVAIHGTITAVNGDEFTIETGTKDINVTFDEMETNPLDRTGQESLKVGDRVCVIGDFEDSIFDDRELEANSVRKLSDASTS